MDKPCGPESQIVGNADSTVKLSKPTQNQNCASVAIKKRLQPGGTLTMLLHITALIFAAAITFLCARDTYFNDISAPYINIELQAFQFVAKVHDIIVAGSLSDIVLYYLTYGICETDGVPLGYLTAPFQLATPLSLFQKEYIYAFPFWNNARGRWSRQDWRALRLGLLILLATAVTLIISPLSAILFVPQLGWWDVLRPFGHDRGRPATGENSGFIYWNTSYEELWPSIVTPKVVPDPCDYFSCPWEIFPQLTQWARDQQQQHVRGNLIVPEQANMARYLTAGNNRNMEKGYAVSSTSMSGLSRNMGTLWLWAERLNLTLARIGQPVLSLHTADTNVDKQMMSPLVQAQCSTPVEITDGRDVSVSFPSDQIERLASEPPLPSNIAQQIDTADFLENFTQNEGNIKSDVKFVDLSNDPSKPIIGALFAASFGGHANNIPNTTGVKFPKWGIPVTRAMYACTITSHWVPADLSLAPRSSQMITINGHSDPAGWTVDKYLPETSRPISVTLDYMNAINVGSPYITSGQSVFEYELGAFAYNKWFYDGCWDISAQIATVLSLQTADALARIKHHEPMFVWYIGNEQSRHFSNNLGDLNNKGVYGDPNAPNQKIMDNAKEIRDHPELYTEVQSLVQRHGYAWSLGNSWQLGSDILKRFALSIVMIHAAIVILHHIALGVKICKGMRWQCVSWNSPLALILLALQTPEKYALRVRGTSTGVDDSTTYRDIVRVEEGEVQEDLVTEDGDRTRNAVLTVSPPGGRKNRWNGPRTSLLGKTSAAQIEEMEQEMLEYVQSLIPDNSRWPRTRLRPGVKYL